MRRVRVVLTALFALSVSACGGGVTPVRQVQVRHALTSPPELLEFESVAARHELFREMARTSLLEAGQAATQLVLFPVSLGGELVAAPGFEPRSDLLQAPDGGLLHLSFSERSLDRWP